MLRHDAVLKNRNLLSVICAYTNYRDLHALDRVYPENGLLTRFGDKTILAGINARLARIFGDTLPEFKKILRDTGSIISGSFVVQCILQEEWEGSDVDIYVGTETAPLIDDVGTSHPITTVEDFLYTRHKYTQQYYAANRYGTILNDIQWIRNYEANGQQLQVIQVSKKASFLYDYIVDRYDFDICKAVYGVDHRGRDYVKIYALDEIIAKRTTFNYYNRLGESVGRCHKYRARGFHFDIPDGILERVKETCRQGRMTYDKRRGYRDADQTDPEPSTPPYDDDTDIVDVEETDMDFDVMILRCDPACHKTFRNLFWRRDDNKMWFDKGCKLIHVNMHSGLKECGKNCPLRLFVNDRRHFHVDGSHMGHGACRDLILLFGPGVAKTEADEPKPKTRPKAKVTKAPKVNP